jgi:integrase
MRTKSNTKTKTARVVSPRTGSGLKLRPDPSGTSCRPRWEPWPAARAIGLKGKDLKDLNGQWLTRGQALDMADKRAIWARALIAASAGDIDARTDLANALGSLKSAVSSEQLAARLNVQDLIDVAKDMLTPCISTGASDAQPCATKTKPKTGEKPWLIWAKTPDKVPNHMRTVEALLDLWLRDPEDGALSKSKGTQRMYALQADKVIKDIGSAMAASITIQEAKTRTRVWAKSYTTRTVLMMVAVAAAAWKWGRWQGWLHGDSPWKDLGLAQPQGRIVVWKPQQTRDFAAWCDDNGFWDVADAVIILEWTGQRPGDYCAATLDDLDPARRSWEIKEQGKTGASARPGLVPQVIERLQLRRNRYARQDIAVIPTHPFFAIHAEKGQPFTADSLRWRFNRAVAVAIKQDPDAFGYLADLRLQDLRDTCVTRLYAANVDERRICDWTGHSLASCREIWKNNYVEKLDLTAHETAQILEAFTRRLG